VYVVLLLLQKEKFDRAASRQMAVNRKMKESNIQRDFAAGNR
jgi:NADH/NAD ratio-sensing transcriptional regulator Rex